MDDVRNMSRLGFGGSELDPSVLAGELPQSRDDCSRLTNQKPDPHMFKFVWHNSTSRSIDWEDSWETFFAKSFQQALDLETAARCRDPELEALIPVLFDKVIPRLLRPLESGGRSVKSSLVHGDLRYANTGVDAGTGENLIFDACSFYAHNEYEFGQWRHIANGFGPEYLTAYHHEVPKSHPEADYDGRLDLYKLRFNTHVSALFPDKEELRKQMLGDIRNLVQKYGSCL